MATSSSSSSSSKPPPWDLPRAATPNWTPVFGPPRSGNGVALEKKSSRTWLKELEGELSPPKAVKIIPPRHVLREQQQRLETLNGRRFFALDEEIGVKLCDVTSANPEIQAARDYAQVPKGNTTTEIGVLLIDCEQLLQEIGPSKNLTNAIKYTRNSQKLATMSFTPLPENGAPVILQEQEVAPPPALVHDPDVHLSRTAGSDIIGDGTSYSPRTNKASAANQQPPSPAKSFGRESAGSSAGGPAGKTRGSHLRAEHLYSAMSVDPAKVGANILMRDPAYRNQNASSKSLWNQKRNQNKKSLRQGMARVDALRDGADSSWGKNALAHLKKDGDFPSSSVVPPALVQTKGASGDEGAAAIKPNEQNNESPHLFFPEGDEDGEGTGENAETVAGENEPAAVPDAAEVGTEPPVAEDQADVPTEPSGAAGDENDNQQADAEAARSDGERSKSSGGTAKDKHQINSGNEEATTGTSSPKKQVTINMAANTVSDEENKNLQGTAKTIKGLTPVSGAAAGDSGSAGPPPATTIPDYTDQGQLLVEQDEFTPGGSPIGKRTTTTGTFRFYALLLATRTVDNDQQKAYAQPFGAADPVYVVKLSLDIWDEVLQNVPKQIWPLESVPFTLVPPPQITASAGAAAASQHQRGQSFIDVVQQFSSTRSRLSAAEKVHHVLKYLKRDVELAAWKTPEVDNFIHGPTMSQDYLQGVMPKATAASFHTASSSSSSTSALPTVSKNSICLTKPGDYFLNAVFPENHALYLVGKSFDIECVDVNQHNVEIEKTRIQLSKHCALAEARYPFYVIPWEECRSWVKLKSHENCLDDGSIILFEDISTINPETGMDKELVIVYISHEYAREQHPDNERGEKIKAMQKYGRSLVSQYGGEEVVSLFFYLDYCCTEAHRHYDHKDKESLEPGYLWNCNHFLALVPSLMNQEKQIQGMQSYAVDKKCQAELFSVFLSGLRHVYWTDGDVGGRLDLPPVYPACWCTHLAAKLALYANLWSEDLSLHQDQLFADVRRAIDRKGAEFRKAIDDARGGRGGSTLPASRSRSGTPAGGRRGSTSRGAGAATFSASRSRRNSNTRPGSSASRSSLQERREALQPFGNKNAADEFRTNLAQKCLVLPDTSKGRGSASPIEALYGSAGGKNKSGATTRPRKPSFKTGASSSNADNEAEVSKPVSEPRPGFFEELAHLADMPNFFRWKKSVALGWVVPGALTIDKEVVAQEEKEAMMPVQHV
ncbi:unnamed protein product [Amoebophrya sp. A120]|nr:unnamed protein product [Amoebophrya sp. A120]|eukprot:GSA120T00007815001.1